MAIIKIVLRNEKRENDTYPLAIRINKDGKVSFIYLDYCIKKSDWDKKAQHVLKSHPNHARLNAYLLKERSSATDNALIVETAKPTASVRAIRQKIRPKVGETFFAQANDYINCLVANKNFNVYSADKPRIKKFRTFLKGQDIAFSDISVGLLEKYRGFLKAQKNKKGKSLSDVTVMNHFVVIRSVYAHARKNKQHIPEDYYPFGKGKFQIKLLEGAKIGLNVDEVKLIENANFFDKPDFEHARNVWLMSFYFAGTRVADTLLLKRKDFKDGRLYYTMEKNDKTDSLVVPEKALQIVEKYRFGSYNHNLVFPDLECVKDITDDWEVQRRIKRRVAVLDGALRGIAKELGIEKELTMHIARHTFGNLSGDKIHPLKLQGLYRHAHLSTTLRYQKNHIHESKDEALMAVLEF